ncbi:serine/threonine-protein kinase [Blastocystis sp. subtype 4]|uniref:serine/threonine-protein kinase n=1 Tax=Blastocystis sp. subtype 4 TaxID=944170 RepID=UPI000711F26D|nr:serine/threonine-protein kinase [Blastocystis sp. subtype 4]KNB41643.1 serine/threonine-protein kinase [Blastocystis sp. subtype 4]|eukprot:XP_014525086.1 serine/threonine-protein kinase [Blastocystis sp. subtype 4]
MATPTDPEQIFEIQEKIGEGSYGSVVKALHKRANRLVAIKIVPVDSDLNELIKEISILKSCKSEYIVRYYGSYYKNNDLWIVMEYCGAGSLSDLMMKGRFSLKEEEIRYVVSQMLLGIAYLHQQRKIHRDIKAGNVLLTESGIAKLADFGVSVQLDSTLAKRKTVIGTPFWMAPEVIQEMDYDSRADIWSLGITAIELAEGVPPYSNIHPMRAIFMIPNRPPPRLQNESRWSKPFVDFISQCLVKDPTKRPTARQLLDHPFVADTVKQLQAGNSQPQLMISMIARLRDLKSRVQKAESQSEEATESVRPHHDIPLPSRHTMVSNDGSTQEGTMITKGTGMTSSPGDTMVVKWRMSGIVMYRESKPSQPPSNIIPLNSVTPPPNLHNLNSSPSLVPLRAPLSQQRHTVTPQPLPLCITNMGLLTSAIFG